MAWKPQPMKMCCPQCHSTKIFAPPSDVILFLPYCRKCNIKMEHIGQAEILDWIKEPSKLFNKILSRI